MKKLLSAILIAFSTVTLAQVNYFNYKKNKYEWPETKPVYPVVPPDYSGYDAYYVFDSTLFSVGASLGSVNAILIERHFRIHLNTEKGVSLKKNINIPESLDPAYDMHNMPFSINKEDTGPWYYETGLEKLAARIIKPDGSVTELNSFEEYIKTDKLEILFKNSLTYKYLKYHYWKLTFQELKPGDELELFYQVMVPYNDNFMSFNSRRIFLNGDLPKQNYSLVMKYNIGPVHDFRFINNCEADTTELDKKTKYYYWSKKDMHATLNEAGSRPYTSLPYIIYTLNTQLDFFKYNDAFTSEIRYVPYWVYIMRYREHFDYSMRRNAENGLKDKQNLLVRDFMNNVITGLSDTTPYSKFNKIHTFIADSFIYMNDEALFREEENRGERLGEFTIGNKIREISRQKLYAKILNMLELNYMTLYLTDKRYATITADYLSPAMWEECVYSVFYNNNVAFAHPKKSDYGWYLEELPFYWENSNGLLVSNDFLYYHIPEKAEMLHTSTSSLNDNFRNTNVMAMADLESSDVTFDARVTLSGQFSTLTRSIYTKNISDSICNPFYSIPVYKNKGSDNYELIEITNSEKSFPFRTDIKCKYTAKKIMHKNGDGTYDLDLSGWFNHIIEENLPDTKRYLDYFPDFASQDTYRYMIKFSSPVTLVNPAENVEIKNSLGNLTVRISQPQPDVIMIESQHVTIASLVRPEKYGDVLAMYGTISDLNHSSIKISLP